MPQDPKSAGHVSADARPVDTLFVGGRVIDPETGLDTETNLGVRNGLIEHLSDQVPPSATHVDVTGKVVAPGFVDLHSHCQSTDGLRVRAADGVTTALELEAGAFPVRAAYEQAESTGRPVNYGFSCSWALSRVSVMEDIDVARVAARFAEPAWLLGQFAHLNQWQQPGRPDQVARIMDVLTGQLRAGGIGIGVMLGYLPKTRPSEYLEIARLAAQLGVPTFTHTRFISGEEPDTSLDGVLELVAAAAGTGAHMHMCHLNSSSQRMIDSIRHVIENAQGSGVKVTTEAYPYGSGSTEIGAPFLDPANLSRIGIQPQSILYLPTSERVESVQRLEELRDSDPGGLVIFDWLDESAEADADLLTRSLLMEDTVVASDAMPISYPSLPGHSGGSRTAGGFAHPRTAGSYARILRWLVRELQVMTLPEAVRRCSLLPAQLLEQAVPAMRNKGRAQVGADADLVVFDPDVISERATYADPLQASAGIEHVLVQGVHVVRHGEVVESALPGQPLYGRVEP